MPRGADNLMHVQNIGALFPDLPTKIKTKIRISKIDLTSIFVPINCGSLPYFAREYCDVLQRRSDFVLLRDFFLQKPV